MTTKLTRIASAGLFLLLLSVTLGAGKAQAQELVPVPQGFGTINDVIQGDTLADGTRRNPEAIYVLERNGRYLTNGRLRHEGGYHLQIVAADGEGAPPVVQPGVREDGTADNPQMQMNGDFTLRGLWILNRSDAGGDNSNGIVIGTEGITGVIDQCIFEVATWLGVRVNTPGVTLKVTNSVVRNLINGADPGNGKFLDPRGTNPELFYLENNTFYNMTSEVTRESGAFIKNYFFNHNTLFNVGSISRNDARVHKSRIMNGTFTNNQLINVASLGDITTEYDYFGGAVIGRTDVGALWPLDSLKADGLGFAETDRNVRITNNNIYWAPNLKDYYNSNDTLQIYSLLSPLGVQQMSEGLVTMANNLEEDPGFAAPPPEDRAVNYATAWYTTFCKTDPVDPGCDFGTNYAEYDPLVSVPGSPWPLPEDFSYDMAAASYTGGTGGFPIGDLNWFPEQKAAWLAAGGGQGTIVANEEFGEVPAAFALHGNFPNPFNPKTTVVFDLAAPADVSVHIYDILGRNVMTIAAQSFQAGARQSVNVDASSLASGMYLYQVVAKSATDVVAQTGKMVLLK
ncbi:MAG: T9SS type A sorting domain-containing protein [Rhodothermales bacterium]